MRNITREKKYFLSHVIWDWKRECVQTHHSVFYNTSDSNYNLDFFYFLSFSSAIFIYLFVCLYSNSISLQALGHFNRRAWALCVVTQAGGSELAWLREDQVFQPRCRYFWIAVPFPSLCPIINLNTHLKQLESAQLEMIWALQSSLRAATGC